MAKKSKASINPPEDDRSLSSPAGDVVSGQVEAPDGLDEGGLSHQSDGASDASSDESESEFSGSGSYDERETDDGYHSVKSHASKTGLDITQKNSAMVLELESECMQGVRLNASENNALDLHANRLPPVPRFNAPPPVPGSIDAVLKECGGAPSGNLAGPSIKINQQQVRSHSNKIPPLISSNAGSLKNKEWGPQVWTKNVPAEFHNCDEPKDTYTIDGVINMDESEAAEIKTEYEHALVGRVACSNFKFEWLSSQLNAKWGSYEGFRSVDLGQGCFMLHFASREHRDAVWLGGPWHIAGKVVGLDRWTPKFIPSKNPQLLAPTWVRIPGLPLLFWGEKNLRRIATAIGEPIYIDAFTKSRSRASYARICVRRNLAEPLLGGLWLNSKETGKFFQKLSYEGMDPVCTSCGFTGHGAEECKFKADAKVINDCDPNRMGLDGWTCIQPKKPPKPKPDQNNIIISKGKLAASDHPHPSSQPIKKKPENFPSSPGVQNTNSFDSLQFIDEAPEEILLPNDSKVAVDTPKSAKTIFHPGESSNASQRPSLKATKEAPKMKSRKLSSVSDEDPSSEDNAALKPQSNKKKSREDYLADVDESKKVPPPPRKTRGRKNNASAETSSKTNKAPQQQYSAKLDKAGVTPSRQ